MPTIEPYVPFIDAYVDACSIQRNARSAYERAKTKAIAKKNPTTVAAREKAEALWLESKRFTEAVKKLADSC